MKYNKNAKINLKLKQFKLFCSLMPQLSWGMYLLINKDSRIFIN